MKYCLDFSMVSLTLMKKYPCLLNISEIMKYKKKHILCTDPDRPGKVSLSMK